MLHQQQRGRLGFAIIVGAITTAVVAWLSFLSAFVIFDVAGGSFGGFGEAGKSADWWALPAWVALTVAFLALDVVLIRTVYRPRERTHR